MSDNRRIEELRRRVDADPGSIAFAALAEEYRRAGQFNQAIDVCRKGLANHPSYLSARVTLGRSLIELDRLDEAKAELELVLRSAPENLAAIRGLAEIHRRKGQLPEALEQYKAAIEIAQHEASIQQATSEPVGDLSAIFATAPDRGRPVVAEPAETEVDHAQASQPSSQHIERPAASGNHSSSPVESPSFSDPFHELEAALGRPADPSAAHDPTIVRLEAFLSEVVALKQARLAAAELR